MYENSSSVSRDVPYGLTDKYGKVIVAFRNFVKTPNNARVAKVFHYFEV